MTLSEELIWRGFVNQYTFKDIADLDKQEKWTFYHGFDASAPSQTIGNLAAMMFDKLFMRHGHNAIILAGGATSLIGDPGGKDKERELQTTEQIAINIEEAKKQFQKIYKGHDYKVVNNLDWTKNLSVIDFLRDIGKHYSMTPLVQRDYIAKRMNTDGVGITYAEFSYTILQGMDFLYLYDKYGCTLQLGGSDQWGNCLSGVDLIRRARGKEAHVVTINLVINSATGKKFGKSEDGAVWLNPEMTSPFKFYQFWLNVEDKGVEGYLKLYTELSREMIEQIIDEFNKDKSSRLAQKVLAEEVTNLVHGEEVTEKVKRVTDLLFAGNYQDLTKDDFSLLKSELSTVNVDTKDFLEVMIEGGLANSKTEARRLLGERSISINGVQCSEQVPNIEHIEYIDGYAIIKRGKNKLMIASK